MATELPEGISIESIWAVEAGYAPDAPEKRPAVRAEHLERMMALRDAGVVVEVGAFADWSGSLILIRAASEEAALEVVHADPYWRSGVWSFASAKRFGRAVRTGELEPHA